jgi:hypothetical protein
MQSRRAHRALIAPAPLVFLRDAVYDREGKAPCVLAVRARARRQASALQGTMGARRRRVALRLVPAQPRRRQRIY